MILWNKGYSVGYMKPIGNMLVDVNGVLSDEDVEKMRRSLTWRINQNVSLPYC